MRVHDQQTVLEAEAARWTVPVSCPPTRDQLDDGQEFPRAVQAVHLLTMHQAKGCESPVVFLAGVQEGLMPYRKAVTPEARYEELRLPSSAWPRRGPSSSSGSATSANRPGSSGPCAALAPSPLRRLLRWLGRPLPH